MQLTAIEFYSALNNSILPAMNTFHDQTVYLDHGDSKSLSLWLAIFNSYLQKEITTDVDNNTIT